VEEHTQSVDEAAEQEARRSFLIRCGRFAAVTPPAIATLLSVSNIPEVAHASTIGRRHGEGDDHGKKKGWFKDLLG
jgi:hypothetical protein